MEWHNNTHRETLSMLRQQEKIMQELLDDTRKTSLMLTGLREKLKDNTHGIKIVFTHHSKKFF